MKVKYKCNNCGAYFHLRKKELDDEIMVVCCPDCGSADTDDLGETEEFSPTDRYVQ